jgi:hypothetical protein
VLEVFSDLLENPNCHYGKLMHGRSPSNGTKPHGTWKDVTWTIHGFGGSMLNFLAQVGFVNEQGNKWDHIYVGNLKMPKLEIAIIHCKLFCGLNVGTQPI